jgi:hypothetical protein
MARIAFRAKVRAGGPGGAWFHADFPRWVTGKLGTSAAVRVAGTIDGFRFRSSAFPNGDGTHHIMVNKAMRDATGLGHGDAARFVLERDTAPRTVRVPPELRAALAADARARANFAGMPPSHRARYAAYVAEAKQRETRRRRAAQALERLRQGKGAWT